MMIMMMMIGLTAELQVKNSKHQKSYITQAVYWHLTDAVLH